MSGSLEQGFSTAPLANLRVCLYTLTIRAPDATFSSVQSYTFPLSPQMVRKDFNVMTAIHDVQGPPSSNGVTRLADQFGQAPPFITIEGTTGWRTHSADGFIWSGLASIGRVETMLATFAQLNQKQMLARAPLMYRMEFYDYFKNEFWEVVPVGPQGIRQTAASPLLNFYSFHFAAIRKVSTPLGTIVDTVLAKLFGVGALSALGSVSSICGSLGAL